MPHGHLFARVLTRAAFVAVIACPALSVARAESRPTSSDMSLWSGRTLGIDQTVVAAGAGWPDAWAEITHAPSSTFNVGVRASLLYGSPLMGFGSSFGVALSGPIRLHLYGKGKLDIALALRPFGVAGYGALVGEKGAFDNDFAYALGTEAFGLTGIRFSEAITFVLGAGFGAAWTDVPDRPDAGNLVGSVLAVVGLEALLSRDTLLFAHFTGGYGLAPERSFDGHGVARGSIGLAYLL